MTRFDTSYNDAAFRICITPNHSLTDRQTYAVLAILAAPGFAVALAATAFGAWPVLPFFGLELVALVGGFLVVRRRASAFELLSADDTHINVRQHRARSDQEYRFIRYWTRVELLPAPFRGHPSLLRLGSHGRFVEIGCDLTEEDRIELAHRLNRLLVAV